MKYNIDSIIIINNIEWRVAGVAFRFGKEWQYTLQRETTDGAFKTIYMNENSINEIFMQESQTDEPLSQIGK